LGAQGGNRTSDRSQVQGGGGGTVYRRGEPNQSDQALSEEPRKSGERGSIEGGKKELLESEVIGGNHERKWFGRRAIRRQRPVPKGGLRTLDPESGGLERNRKSDIA